MKDRNDDLAYYVNYVGFVKEKELMKLNSIISKKYKNLTSLIALKIDEVKDKNDPRIDMYKKIEKNTHKKFQDLFVNIKKSYSKKEVTAIKRLKSVYENAFNYYDQMDEYAKDFTIELIKFQTVCKKAINKVSEEIFKSIDDVSKQVDRDNSGVDSLKDKFMQRTKGRQNSFRFEM